VQDSQAVLLIADDAAFSRDLIGRWQAERTVPGFTVVSTDLFAGAVGGNFHLAIVGPVRPGRLSSLLKQMDVGAHPVLCILQSASETQAVKAEHPRLLVMQEHENWLESVLLLATECLRRVELSARLRQAEKILQIANRTATLGRYMLDNRHDFSNLLTSVLGNAELLLDGTAELPELARDQIQTIHATALQIHEIMQRFGSLAVEMQVAEKESQDETRRLSHFTASPS
jgi:signal transduction histidine kinase